MTAGAGSESLRIGVSLSRQQLTLFAGEVVSKWPVSTARTGPGETKNSESTPRGLHTVRAMIGAGAESGAVFVGRRPTGEIYCEELAAQFPKRDWILSRILWLSGCEPGRNRLGNVDSMQRYIYIHGTPDTEPMGVPYSHGCIRMANADVIELFDQVHAGIAVQIEP